MTACRTSQQPPAGFRLVSREIFFKTLAQAAGDPMPTTKHREFTTWEEQKGERRVWGWSTPGWVSASGTPRLYAVNEELVP